MTPEQNWPADKVERWPIARLIPYAKNARTHSAEQIDQLVASFEQFGWTNPVLVDSAGELIAGHGRVLAAKQIGLDEVPVMVATGWSPQQIRAYRLADNQLALNAGWDAELLRLEVNDLRALGVDAGLMGFNAADLVSIFGTGEDGGVGEGEAKADHARMGSLVDRFGIVPFTVLNAREGWWQDRKRGWISLGIQSEVGRGLNELEYSSTIRKVFEGNNPHDVARRSNGA